MSRKAPELLTPTRMAILRIVRDGTRQVIQGPTQAEIVERLGFQSKHGLWDHIRRLREAGLLQSAGQYLKRSILLTPKAIELLDAQDAGASVDADDETFTISCEPPCVLAVPGTPHDARCAFICPECNASLKQFKAGYWKCAC